jgi:TonB family protein
MPSLSRDQLYAWIGTGVLHLLALLVLVMWRIESTTGATDFVEVELMKLPPPPVPKPEPMSIADPRAASRKGKPVLAPGKSSRLASRVKLPERSSLTREEVFRLPPTKKIDTHEGAASSTRTTGSGVGKKEAKGGISGKKNEQSLAVGRATGRSASGSLDGVGTVASDIGKALFGSVQWIGGGKRKKVSGDLPRYPAGVNVQAQIKIEAVVSPNGTVKSTKPVQKANARLEDAAMRELRRWRFEPLARTLPQREQRCVVTFNFKLD